MSQNQVEQTHILLRFFSSVLIYANNMQELREKR